MTTSHSGGSPAGSGDTEKKLRPARTNATKQKLFEASMELIGERGAAGVTVDEIATAAGVSKGTVYYNFGSKSDLIAQLLRHGVDILLARLLSVRDGSADPLAAMEEMIGQAMDFMAEYPSFARLWVSESWRTPSEWQDTFAELRGRLLAVIGSAIACANSDQLPLELSQATEHREHESAVRRGGVCPCVFQAAETSFPLGNGGHNIEQIAG